MVNGVGVVLGGTVKKGSIVANQSYMMGPDKNGNFRPVIVKGIHENRVDILHASRGATVCIAVKTANKKD